MTVSPRARALLLLALTFAAGVAAGAAIEPRLGRSGGAIERRGRTSPNRERELEQIPVPLERLGLTDTETTQLRAIARHWRPQTAVALDEFRKRVSDMEDGMFAEMLCELAPDQRDRYLSQLRDGHYDEQIIARRFELVRSNHCGKTGG
ncbi:MAG TPA: hypothetical protein VII52_16195 [Gemmatimonadaceae bacterium]